MKKKKIILILLTAFLLFFGCSKKQMSGEAGYDDSVSFQITERSHYSEASSTAWAGTGYNGEFDGQAPAFKNMSNLYGEMGQDVAAQNSIADDSDSGDSMSAELNNVERKLVKRASIRMRVENLEAADASIAGLMEKYGAYAASTEIEENSYRYSLRVPSPEYDIFLSEMNGIGRTLRRLETTEDVTLQYYDLEGRLVTKRELLRTYQSYLGRARNIEEILSVEARIAELQSDIEGTGKQLRSLANRVDYATIDLNLLGPVVSTSNKDSTFGDQIKNLFGGFGGFLSAVTMVIIGIVIYGIPILLLLALLYLVLFGRIGLLKKLWRVVTVKNRDN